MIYNILCKNICRHMILHKHKMCKCIITMHILCVFSLGSELRAPPTGYNKPVHRKNALLLACTDRKTGLSNCCPSYNSSFLSLPFLSQPFSSVVAFSAMYLMKSGNSLPPSQLTAFLVSLGSQNRVGNPRTSQPATIYCAQ